MRVLRVFAALLISAVDALPDSFTACLQYEEYVSQLSPEMVLRIVGGGPAEEHEFPHMAALGYYQPGGDEIEWRCAATLISEQFLLTAAHCLTRRDTGFPKKVLLGQLDLRAKNDSKNIFSVKAVFIHPDYSKTNVYNDIGLLKLTRAVTFSPAIYPACLYRQEIYPENNLIATGWGSANPTGTDISNKLQKVVLQSVPQEDCQKTFKSVIRKLPNGLLPTMFCAADPAGLGGTCTGDSGGPIQTLDSSNSMYYVLGITSFGSNVCGGNIPTIFMKISEYMDWIEEIIWEH